MIHRKLLLSFVLSFVFPIVLLSAHSYADPLDNWHWRNPTPQGNPLNAVTYGNGTFVAVGRMGAVVRSTDGVTWTAGYAGITNHLFAIAYGDGRFIAVGEGGAIVTSQDGEVWTSQVSGTTSSLRSVAYGNGAFVALGEDDTILFSTDGATWTKGTKPGQDSHLDEIAFGNGMFVAVGNNTILATPDGINWITGEGVFGLETAFDNVAFGNGVFVVAGRSHIDGRYLIYTSSDGTHWTRYRLETSYYFTDISYGNGIFIAAKDRSVFTSTDGVNWTAGDKAIPGGYECLTVVVGGNGFFVAIGGYLGKIYTSSDGENWVERSSGNRDSLRHVSFLNGYFIATGYGPAFPGVVFTSPDGINWTMASDTSSYIQGMTYGNGLFVTVGRNGTILTSPDLINWTARDSKATHDFSGVVYGNGVFFATTVGSPRTSPDGINWTTRYWPNIDKAVYGNGIFVGLEIDDQRWAQARIMTSFNGIDWTVSGTVAAGSPIWPSEIAFGNGVFVILSTVVSEILTSSDGENWESRLLDYSLSLSGLTYGNNTFVIAGMNAINHDCDLDPCPPDGPGVIFTSPDGVNWEQRNIASDQAFFDVTYGNGTFVAVGENGAIFQSDLVVDDCAASLSDDLVLKVPKIIFDGKALSAELQYESFSQAMLRVTKVESLSQPVDFEFCSVSVLRSEDNTFKLRVPVIYYSGASYWADLEYVPTGDGQIWFKVIGADRN